MVRLMLLLLLILPASALAQAQSCRVPERFSAWRVESPPPGAVLNVPIEGYLLSLSWSPQFCKSRRADPDHGGQCGPDAGFGFILHGLWPEGSNQKDPAWCAPAKPIAEALMKQHFCMTPSADLLQHEWAKHGTCMTDKPERYFATAAILYRAVRFPDMDGLLRRSLTTGAFMAEFAKANPGLTPAMLRVSVTEGGWLKEVRLCLAKDFKPRPCPKSEPTAAPRKALRIWRGMP